jgi:hypothetical protein
MGGQSVGMVVNGERKKALERVRAPFTSRAMSVPFVIEQAFRSFLDEAADAGNVKSC